MSEQGNRCADVSHRDFRPHRCTRAGNYEEDGQFWCYQHAPSEVKARQEKRNAAWEARQDQQAAAEQAQRAQKARAALCVAACAGVPDDLLPPGMVVKLLALLGDAKAGGGN